MANHQVIKDSQNFKYLTSLQKEWLATQCVCSKTLTAFTVAFEDFFFFTKLKAKPASKF